MNKRQKKAYKSIRFRLVNYVNRATSVYYVEVERGWWIFKNWKRFHGHKYGGVVTTGGNQFKTKEEALWKLAAAYGYIESYTYYGTLIKVDDFQTLLYAISPQYREIFKDEYKCLK